jgi:hypothetical protein
LGPDVIATARFQDVKSSCSSVIDRQAACWRGDGWARVRHAAVSEERGP